MLCVAPITKGEVLPMQAEHQAIEKSSYLLKFIMFSLHAQFFFGGPVANKLVFQLMLIVMYKKHFFGGGFEPSKKYDVHLPQILWWEIKKYIWNHQAFTMMP